MSPDEYDNIAKALTDELNQKGTLIEFRVLDSLEYVLRFAAFRKDPELREFVIEWSVKIADKPLAGYQVIESKMITDSVVNVSDFVIGEVIRWVVQAITHPDKIRETKPLVTINYSSPAL